MSSQQTEDDTGKEPQNKGQKGVNREARRIVGEIIVLLVFLGFDAVEVFPSNHFLALLGAVVGISGVAFMELSTRAWMVTTAALVVAATIFLLEIPTSTIDDRAKLAIISLVFANGAPLQPGPINLQMIFMNRGKDDAAVTEGRTTPAIVRGGRLPDKPQYPTHGRVIRGIRIIPGVPFYAYSETADLVLKQADVDAIKAGTERLYFYGYMKYGAQSEYAFIGVYDPKVNAFVWDGDEYPAYVRDE